MGSARNRPAYRLDTWPLPPMRAVRVGRSGGDSGRFADGLATLAAGLVGMGIAVMVLVLALVVLFVVN